MFDTWFPRHWSTLKKLIWLKASVLASAVYQTVTGAIVTFTTLRAAPLRSLAVTMGPKQDLNGYSYPWPAGGGKNLFNGTFLQGYWAYADGGWVNSNAWIATEKIPCKPSTYYTVSADNRQTRWQGFVYYDNNGDFISTQNLNNKLPIGYTAKTPANAAYLIFNIAGKSESTDPVSPSDVTHFQIEEGQTATSYAPYSNICPISGWAGANVTRTGKNLFDGTFIANTMIVDSTGEYYANEYHKCSNRILAKENTTYTLSGTDLHKRTGTATSAANVTIAYYKVDGTYIRREAPDTSANTYKTVTTPANTAFVIFQVGGQATNVMLEESATETTYEPYTGNTYSITFPSEAGTVYGGTLDVTTGKLTVDRAMVDLGTKKWYLSTSAGRTRFRASITDVERISSPNIVAPMLCSAYKTETANNTYTGKQGISLQQNAADVYVYDPQTESMTTAEFKSAMSGVQLVYKLATPIVYDLTPTQIELFAGENNIWSDGEMTLTYLADGNASDEEALNILLGGRYVNNHGEDEPTDREALNIILGENER